MERLRHTFNLWPAHSSAWLRVVQVWGKSDPVEMIAYGADRLFNQIYVRAHVCSLDSDLKFVNAANACSIAHASHVPHQAWSWVAQRVLIKSKYSLPVTTCIHRAGLCVHRTPPSSVGAIVYGSV